MRFPFLQKVIDILRFKRQRYYKHIRHRKYGKVYLPYYDYSSEMSNFERPIYNKDGKRMRTFFLRDVLFANKPTAGESKYFIWDRFNYGVDIHFYSHRSMLETVGKPVRKYGLLIESESIIPEDYELFEKHKGLAKDFDLIFTYSAKLLDKYDNARFVPFCGRIFYKEDIKSDAHLSKTKNISILSSNKLMCDMHKLRYDIAHKCKREHLADTYGTFDGGNFVNIVDTLNDYRYTICIENDIKPYFFTERITTAFATGTIPIYYGATEIDKFFNPDGIIKFNKNDDISKILKQCTKEEYERRMPAILDNMQRVQEYFSCSDYMAEHYLTDICDVK